MPVATHRSIIFDRNNSDHMRELARDLATAAKRQWDRLPFDEIVYWLHQAMKVADDTPKARC